MWSTSVTDVAMDQNSRITSNKTVLLHDKRHVITET
jgi:hypothetical protein